jgi:hypothetical protein
MRGISRSVCAPYVLYVKVFQSGSIGLSVLRMWGVRADTSRVCTVCGFSQPPKIKGDPAK